MIECHADGSTTTMSLLEPKDLPNVWQDLMAKIAEDSDFADLYTPEWIFEQIVKQKLQVWQIEDALLLTQVSLFPRASVFQIIFANGEGLVKNIPLCWEIFQRFAVTQNCTSIVLFGRKGWARKLAKQFPEVKESAVALKARVAWPKGH
jgi:hypothetical protein